MTAMSGSPSARIAAVDLARGLAIVAMVIYHAAWDFGSAGLIGLDAEHDLPLVILARLTAGTFLFLVGVSLVLAHRSGLRPRPFLRRLAIIAAAALIVTLVTRFAVPDGYVRFGILHAIAAASVIGVLFLRTPPWVALLAAAAVFAAPYFLADPFFNRPGWTWLGLATVEPRSIDHVPILPWLGPTLLGIAATKIALAKGVDRWFARWQPENRLSRGLIVAGRWSLIIYLVHQPVLLGIVYAISAMTGAAGPMLI